MGELDVIGMNFKTDTVFICEVTTHLHGLRYGNSYKVTFKKIQNKHERQVAYAKESLKTFKRKRFMFWSPRVPKGKLTEKLSSLKNLELIINEEYTAKIDQLRAVAKKTTNDMGNPFFRTLQILEHLR